VGDANTLGRTGGTRGVHDAENVLGVAGLRLNQVLLAELSEFLPGDDVDIRIVLFVSLDLAAQGEDAVLVDNDSPDF
jgi:hypothetical protein